MCEVKYNVTIDTYKEHLEERIISYLSELKGIPLGAQPGPVPVCVRSAATARNRKGPAKRSFRGVCPPKTQIRARPRKGSPASEKMGNLQLCYSVDMKIQYML